MDFKKFMGQTPARQPKKICKIITKKVGNKIEKSIEGDCSPAQLKALSEANKIELED